MNAKTLAIAITTAVVAVATHAYAGESALSTIAVRADAPLVVECCDERLPTIKDVGELLDSNNGGYVYAQRERVAHTAHRECMRGAARIVFVRDSATMPASLALAEVRK